MSSFKRIFPLINRIIVKKAEQQTKTASGIIVSKAETAAHGVVIETGPGAYDHKGRLVPLIVKVGDRVLLPEFEGLKVKIDGQELYIFRDTDIIGKLE